MNRIKAYFSIIMFSIVLLLSGRLVLRASNKNDDKASLRDKIKQLEIIGEYSLDGKEFHPLSDDTYIDVKKGQHIHLVGKFNHNIEKEEILFTITNFNFSMKVNGVTMIDYGQPESYPKYIKSVGFRRFLYSVKHISTEDLIEIDLIYPYSKGGIRSFREFKDGMYVGEKVNFYLSILTQYSPIMLMGATVILFGIITLIGSIVLQLWRSTYGSKTLSFAIFLITGGIWFVMDTVYSSPYAIIMNPLLVNMIDMINLLLLPMSGVYFISAFFQNCTTKRLATVAKIIQFVSVCSALVLQVCGITDLYECQILSIPLNAVLSIFILIIACYEVIKEKNRSVRLIFIAIIPLVLGVYFDIMVYFFNGVNYRYLFRFGFIISTCLLIVITLMLFKESIERKEREKYLQSELTSAKVAIMLSQIQPHFLYNALNTIQHICETNSKIAAEAIEKFAKYLRGNMDSINKKELIPFEKELQHLENYLYIENLRFGERVKVKYDLNVTDFMMPCLIVQPIVENAIRYGITKKIEGGTIEISTQEDKSDIIINIVDDGIGFDLDQTQHDNRSHIGIQNVRERLKLQCAGSLNIQSVLNEGTEVTIRIPKEGVLLF